MFVLVDELETEDSKDMLEFFNLKKSDLPAIRVVGFLNGR